MIYTKLTNKALKFSFKAHKKQKDKGKIPYVYHPFLVAEKMDTEEEICVALLHDIVEDTKWTLEDLKAKGFPSSVIDALALMTHNDDTPYLDYVRKLSSNPLAAKVKLADLRHNSTPGRLKELTDHAIERMKKYLKAQAILTGGIADLDNMCIRVSRDLTGQGGCRSVLQITYEPCGRIREFLLRRISDNGPEGADRMDGVKEERFTSLRDFVRALEERGFSAADVPELFRKECPL